MNKNTYKKRIKLCIANSGKVLESTPTSMSRRGENSIVATDINTEDIVADFFEFEKELSEMRPSNKLDTK